MTLILLYLAGIGVRAMGTLNNSFQGVMGICG